MIPDLTLSFSLVLLHWALMSSFFFPLSLIPEGSEPGIIEVSHVFSLPRDALAIVGFHLQKAA